MACRQFPAGGLDNAWHESLAGGCAVLDLAVSEGLQARPWQAEDTLFRADARYLITGGFGGFGLLIAHWMAQRGARYLTLVGRRGAVDAGKNVAELELAGVRVQTMVADVSDESQVLRLLDDVRREMPPLRGIIHTAGIVDDGLISDLKMSRMARVLGPKAYGAWYLHQHTKDIELDHFVLFSSISALIGNVGQASYVAANAFLDSLAQHRQANGLSGLSLNWGVLGEVGMAARQKDVKSYLERMGINAMSPTEALQAFEYALHQSIPQLGIMALDWKRWGSANAETATLPRYSRLISREGEDTGENSSQSFQARLLELPPERRLALASEQLQRIVAEITHIPVHSLDPSVPLVDLGLDSLMASELQMMIQKRASVRISVLDLMKGVSIAGLSSRLIKPGETSGGTPPLNGLPTGELVATTVEEGLALSARMT